MNSPLTIFKNKLPNELINIIQSYASNDYMYKLLNEHIQNILKKQEIYDEFIFQQYILPNCYCHSLRYNKDCNHCHLYEYTDHYKLPEYLTCVEYNDQFAKILLYDNPNLL